MYTPPYKGHRESSYQIEEPSVTVAAGLLTYFWLSAVVVCSVAAIRIGLNHADRSKIWRYIRR